MNTLDVTLAYALPVRAEALVTQLETQQRITPAIHMLRLCNRFGKGRFTDFPKELIKIVEGYVVECTRQEVARNWLEPLYRCHRGQCTILDHADKGELLHVYRSYMDEAGPEQWEVIFSTPESYPQDPDDTLLIKTFDMIERGLSRLHPQHLLDRYARLARLSSKLINEHHRKRGLWAGTVDRHFTDGWDIVPNHFGLKIWWSFVGLNARHHHGAQRRGGPAGDTIAYLTLPNSHMRDFEWDDETKTGQHAFGTAVEICKQPSAEEVRRFEKALKVLKLDVYIHQDTLKPAMELGSHDEPRSSSSGSSQRYESSDEVQSRVQEAASYPRPMLLTRHTIS